MGGSVIDPMFRNMADETLRRLRELPLSDPNAGDRTLAVLAATLREAFLAGKSPSSEGLNHHRLTTLKSILRLAREKAHERHLASSDDTERLFEKGIEEVYRFVELTIEKLERGDFA